MTKHGPGVIRPVSGGGTDRNGRPVPEMFPPDPYALHDPAEALTHYMDGSGEDRSYYFNSVDTSHVKLSDFPKLDELIKNGNPGLYPDVSAIGSYNGDFFGAHDASSWATVGGLNLHADGTLAIAKDGSYRFSGRISAGDDPYDFNNRRGTSRAAQILTTIGRGLPGKSFTVHMIGSKPFSARGRR